MGSSLPIIITTLLFQYQHQQRIYINNNESWRNQSYSFPYQGLQCRECSSNADNRCHFRCCSLHCLGCKIHPSTTLKPSQYFSTLPNVTHKKKRWVNAFNTQRLIKARNKLKPIKINDSKTKITCTSQAGILLFLLHEKIDDFLFTPIAVVNDAQEREYTEIGYINYCRLTSTCTFTTGT